MHFAEPERIKPLRLDCEKCPRATQLARRCDEPIWDHPKGAIFPIQISDLSEGIAFCPQKLWRDDPALVEELRLTFLAWRLGQVPFGGPIDTMDAERAEIVLCLIATWERMSRDRDFVRLARLIGGS